MCLGGGGSAPEARAPEAAPAVQQAAVKSDVDTGDVMDRLRKRRGYVSTILSSAADQADSFKRTTLG